MGIRQFDKVLHVMAAKNEMIIYAWLNRTMI